MCVSYKKKVFFKSPKTKSIMPRVKPSCLCLLFHTNTMSGLENQSTEWSKRGKTSTTTTAAYYEPTMGLFAAGPS